MRVTNFAQFSAIKTKQAIDATTGIISGVSVITEGEAAGRNSGTWIDSTTLSQVHAVASKFPDGIKVKLSQSKEHDGSAGQIVGVLKSFRVDGSQVRADLHLLKSDDNFAKILEMSETMPSEFGLSVVVPSRHEKVDGKECLRVSDIYSIDLVEAPAANPSGLFSKNSPTITMSIKYKNGTDGEHHAECECKECMSKNSKKSMSSVITMSLGLAESATEQEQADALKTALSAIKSTDLTALTKKIEEAETKLASLEAGNANALALSQKSEIDNLIAEASRDGKVVPFDNDDLYTSVDGKVTIKMLPTQLSKVIGKLPKGAIQMAKTKILTPVDKDGKPTTDPEARKAFFAQKRTEGAEQLTALMRSQSSTNFN